MRHTPSVPLAENPRPPPTLANCWCQYVVAAAKSARTSQITFRLRFDIDGACLNLLLTLFDAFSRARVCVWMQYHIGRQKDTPRRDTTAMKSNTFGGNSRRDPQQTDRAMAGCLCGLGEMIPVTRSGVYRMLQTYRHFFPMESQTKLYRYIWYTAQTLIHNNMQRKSRCRQRDMDHLHSSDAAVYCWEMGYLNFYAHLSRFERCSALYVPLYISFRLEFKYVLYLSTAAMALGLPAAADSSTVTRAHALREASNALYI